MTTAFDFQATTIDLQPFDLGLLRGKVLLIVNTASRCGFTPQYRGLQALHERYHAQGLEVLGFPCNQFGGQEPGDAAEIGRFCETSFGVRFRLFDRIEVRGGNAHPLWRWLCAEAPGVLGSTAIKWNFTKFLVRRNGSVFRRHPPQASPESLAADIEALLAEPG